MPELDLVTLERREGWAEIVINRPERRNLIIPPVSVGIADALDEVADDEDIASVLLRGPAKRPSCKWVKFSKAPWRR